MTNSCLEKALKHTFVLIVHLLSGSSVPITGGIGGSLTSPARTVSVFISSVVDRRLALPLEHIMAVCELE